MGAAFCDNDLTQNNVALHLPSAAEVDYLKNIFPFPTNIYIYIRYHQSPHVCPHILRGGTFLLFSCRALVPNKSGRTELDTGPNTKESKPEGRLTRGRACRKLGGAGSRPKNTSIIETLRDFFHRLPTPPCETAARPYALSVVKISNSTPFSSRQNGTAVEINMLTGIN